jgi:hypothetical protein
MPGILTLALLAAFTAQPSQPPLLAPTDRSDTLAKVPNQPGDIPIELMLDPAVGTTQVVELTFDETFKTWDNAEVTYDIKLPPRTFTFVLEVTAEDLTLDERTVAFRIESVATDENNLTGKLSDAFKQSLLPELLAYKNLSGVTGTFKLHAMGRLSDFTHEVPEGTDADAIERQLRAVTNALTSLVPAIPAEPVGLNATWSIESLDKLGSSSVRWPIDCQLTSLAGDILHVTMTGDTYIDVTVEQLPELPDGTVNKKAERRYTLHTTTNHNPRLPVPSEATSVLTTKLDAEYLVADKPTTFRSEAIITTTLRERTSEITFRQEPLSPEDTAAQAALEGTILEVIDDGTADADTAMQLDYPAGQGSAELIFTTAAAEVATGANPTGGVLAPVRCLFDINADDIATTWTLREHRIMEEGQPATVVDNLEKLMRSVAGKSMRHPMLEGRIFSKATQFGDVLAGPTQPNMLLEVTNLWKPPLPFDPVAKGARWNFARPWIDSETGAPIWQNGEATLIDLTADSFTIDYKASFSLLDDTYGLGGRYLRNLASATLNNYDAGMRVRVTWKQGVAAPLEGEAVHSQRTIADVSNSIITGTATSLQSWKVTVRSSPEFTGAPVPAVASPTIDSLTRLATDATRATFTDFTLHSPGDEPRTRLAYNTPAPDQRHVYCLSLRQRNAQSNGTQPTNVTGVTMNFVLSFDAAPTLLESSLPPDPNTPAFRNLRWEFLEGFITLDPDATPEQKAQAQQYEALFAPLAGASGICSLQPTGEITFETSMLPLGGLPTEEHSLRELHEWIGRIFQSLPKDPVGPGASWSRRLDVSLAGTNYPLTLTTVVGAHNGDAIQLTSSGEVTARDRFLSIPNLPASRAASLLEGLSKRTTSATLDSRFVAPVTWSWSDTTAEQRAIRDAGRIIDWLYSYNQTLAAMKHWPDYIIGSSARPTPPTLPAFDDVVFPPRPQ